VGEQAAPSGAIAISNAVLRIHKDGYGKGAVRARTYFLQDAILVELEEPFTRVEQTLIAAGREDQIRETRQIFQQAHRAEFIRAVEDSTGREVRAFLSQVHFSPELAVELFLLEPVEDEA